MSHDLVQHVAACLCVDEPYGAPGDRRANEGVGDVAGVDRVPGGWELDGVVMEYPVLLGPHRASDKVSDIRVMENGV